MTFDFPVEKIDIKFKTFGSCYLTCFINGIEIDVNGPVTILKDKIQDTNTINIEFLKAQPDDVHSYAELEYFKINDGDFSSWFKSHNYNINAKHHPDTKDIVNNGYFGYAGKLEIKFEDCDDLLKKAAWTIADKEFEYTKWPIKGNKHRNKNFQTIHRDAKFMYTGSTPPQSQAITKAVNETEMQDLRGPLHNDAESKIIDWISKSERVKLDGEPFKHFTFSTGVSDSLESFVRSSRVIMMPPKMYHMHGELFAETELIRVNPFERPIPLYANVLLEYPSPWYTNEELDNVIKLAKEKQAKIALDLTWLPVATDKIELDLDGIDQIFFSMNKAWPIHDLRPAFRWSRERINDRQTYDYEIGMYPKTSANIFMKLIDKFSFGYTYNTNKDSVADIMQTFDLEPTSVLWFTKHPSAVHDTKGHISQHYFLDEFVCIQKLLDFKGKYFW